MGVKNILGDQIQVSINTKAEPDKRSYQVSFDKFYKLAQKEFLPKVTLEMSVKRMINALTPFKERLSREERGHLIRLNVLKKLKGNNHLDDQLNWI